MLLDNPFIIDKRVEREALALTEAGYEVTLLCTQKDGLSYKENRGGVKIERIFDTTIFDPKNFRWDKIWAQKIVDTYAFDILHAHDQTMLNIGAAIKKIKQTTLVYDSHELFHSWPLNLSNFKSTFVFVKSFLVRKWFVYREKKNAKKIDFLITVNQSIADDLCRYFQIDKTKIAVVRNTPETSSLQGRSDILRNIFDISDITKILVFIGANIYLNSLNIEQVFEEFGNKENTAIVVIATFNDHSDQVRRYVHNKGFNNIYFHNKIKAEEISAYLSSADVGLVPTWNKHDLSYWYALDNKLFEYIQASLPVLATAQPEYKLIVEKYSCGICINPDQKNAYYEGFEKIMTNKEFYVNNSKNAAAQLNWGLEKNGLLKLYKEIFETTKVC